VVGAKDVVGEVDEVEHVGRAGRRQRGGHSRRSIDPGAFRQSWAWRRSLLRSSRTR
jgi:hypothetical protein